MKLYKTVQSPLTKSTEFLIDTTSFTYKTNLTIGCYGITLEEWDESNNLMQYQQTRSSYELLTF